MTTLIENREEAPPAAGDGGAPRRAAGLELLGRSEGSGFREAPYLVRRSDGQVIQLSPLLYMVGEAADGRRDVAAIADEVTAQLGRRVSRDNVRFLVERKLRPLGVLGEADGASRALEKRRPALALRHRRPLVPERVVQTIAGVFMPMFWPPLVVAAVAALGVFDAWLFFEHGVAGGLRSAIYNPALLLAVFGLVIVATAFHEIGHAAACRYGDARPGPMGAGLYLVWPVFYCDVTDAYRLGRAGRVRTDLGGVYFNAVFALLAGAAFFATGAEALLLLAVVQHIVIVQQLLPLLRFDGYYVLSDLAGVPDVLSRIGPIFRSLLPWRRAEPRVAELKPWVRTVVGAYLATLVPLAVLLLTWLIVGAPRLFATIFDSLTQHADRAGSAAGGGDWGAAALGGLQVMALSLPCAAITLTFGRLGRLLGHGVRRWAGRSRRRKLVAIVGAGAIAAVIVSAWWPDGDYRPLRPGDRGTVVEVISAPDDSAPARATFLTTSEATLGSPARVQAAEGAPAESRTDTGSHDTTREVDGADPREPRAEEETAAPDGVAATPEPASATPDPGAEGTSGSAPQPPSGAEPAPAVDAESTTYENRAQAVNTTDGARVFRLAFDIQRFREGPVLHTNLAQAYASCEACRTIAIAVQVVLVMADVDYAAPVNYAEAINYACTACETLAFAWQLVLSTGGEVQLTDEASERIGEIERALAALENSDGSILEIEAATDQLMDELGEVVIGGLEPVGEPAGPVAEQEPAPSQDSDASSGAEPSPTASPEPTPAPTAEEEPAAEETPSEEPSPTPTPEPTPSTTPEPTPTESAEPTPTPTP